MVAKLIRLGYLQPIDKSLLPNWTANAQDLFQNPWYDPGNVYSVAWQSGIVGIGYNPKLTGREITKFDDLLDPAFNGNVGMFSEMIDTMSMTLLSLGIDPQTPPIDGRSAGTAEAAYGGAGRPVPGFLRQRLLRRPGRRQHRPDHGLVGRHQPDAAVRQPGRQVRRARRRAACSSSTTWSCPRWSTTRPTPTS